MRLRSFSVMGVLILAWVGLTVVEGGYAVAGKESPVIKKATTKISSAVSGVVCPHIKLNGCGPAVE